MLLVWATLPQIEKGSIACREQSSHIPWNLKIDMNIHMHTREDGQLGRYGYQEIKCLYYRWYISFRHISVPAYCVRDLYLSGNLQILALKKFVSLSPVRYFNTFSTLVFVYIASIPCTCPRGKGWLKCIRCYKWHKATELGRVVSLGNDVTV